MRHKCIINVLKWKKWYCAIVQFYLFMFSLEKKRKRKNFYCFQWN